MASPIAATQALALSKESKGESYLAYRILSPELGSLEALTRKSSRFSRAQRIDLFDEGEFILEMKPGAHSGFVKEVHIHRNRKGIAKNYPAFMAAAEIAKLIAANPTHQENADAVYRLLTKGLDAWERGASPKATLFKCLYVYCKDEGYPINEEWRARLSRADKELVDFLLSTPLKRIEKSDACLEAALQNIRHYMQSSTHIFMPR